MVTIEDIADLIEEIDYNFESYSSARDLVTQAHYLTKLRDNVSDLKTWHAGYDLRTGTLPWERSDEEQG